MSAASGLTEEDVLKMNGSAGDQAKLIELVEMMLKFDPKDRITPEQALDHPFFKTTSTRSTNTELVNKCL